jgi:hypothetical protein
MTAVSIASPPYSLWNPLPHNFFIGGKNPAWRQKLKIAEGILQTLLYYQGCWHILLTNVRYETAVASQEDFETIMSLIINIFKIYINLFNIVP